MYDRTLNQISKADIELLIAEQVKEDLQLDFKAELKLQKPSDKKELARDAAAFANAAGGVLVFGVAEDGEGAASALPGVKLVAGEDITRQTIELVIRDRVNPKIPGIEVHIVSGIGQGAVVIVRVPKSWRAPHLVDSSNFYLRAGRTNNPMTVGELRWAFSEAESLHSRLSELRDERLGRLLANQVFPTAAQHPLAVLHAIPASALNPRTRRDTTKKVSAISSSSAPRLLGRIRYNADGAVNTVNQHALTQFFRSGGIEHTWVASVRDPPVIANEAFPGELRSVCKEALTVISELGFEFPVLLVFALLRTQDLKIVGGEPMQREYLLFPDFVIETKDEAAKRTNEAIQVWLDQLWQASGQERWR